MMEPKYAILILAAGGSTRLGEPKQLLGYNDTTLLNHVIDAALAIDSASVLVVTGASHNIVEESLQGSRGAIYYNAEWPSGMGSSIRNGVKEIRSRHGQLEAILVTVCDQPYVSTEIFQKLIALHESGNKGIAACKYAHTIGTPALFGKNYFDMLEKLRGDEGAKKIIRQFSNDVDVIAFEQGNVDIDTQADYRKLMDATQKQV